MKKFNEKLITDKELCLRLVESQSYQEFLLHYFHEAKTLSKNFSYAQFALKSGISKSLVKGILDGKKRITHKTISPIIHALDLPFSLSNFFSFLVALENPTVLNPTLPLPKIKNYIKKYSLMALEEYSTENHSDELFKFMEMPFVYAALGSSNEGSSVDIIIQKTGLDKKNVLMNLDYLLSKQMVLLKDNNYIINRQFLFLSDSKTGSYFQHFYLHLLNKQTTAVKSSFESKEKLFYSSVFSVDSSSLFEIKNELKELLNKYVEQSESPAGDKVVCLQLGLL
jgi:transcriptional regulator with XRE-family HTH domain